MLPLSTWNKVKDQTGKDPKVSIPTRKTQATGMNFQKFEEERLKYFPGDTYLKMGRPCGCDHTLISSCGYVYYFRPEDLDDLVE